jgi:hypothetical protein
MSEWVLTFSREGERDRRSDVGRWEEIEVVVEVEEQEEEDVGEEVKRR